MPNQLPEGAPIDPRLEGVRAQVTDLLAAAAQMQRRTSVLRDVADRVGGVDTLISGRPGSWESEHVAALAQSFN